MKIYQIVSFDTETDAVESVQGIDLEDVLKQGYKMYKADLGEVGGDISDHKEMRYETFCENVKASTGNYIQCNYSHITYELLEFEVPSGIRIPLSNGKTLVAEENLEPGYKEIFVGVMNGKMWEQDLAIIAQEYTYGKNDKILPQEGYSVKVYADAENEDFTHDFHVNEWREEG